MKEQGRHNENIAQSTARIIEGSHIFAKHNGKELTAKYARTKHTQHAWYLRNKEKKKKYAKAYYAAHRASKISWAKEYRKRRPDITLKSHLKCTYGITPETMEKMFTSQNGLCAICSVSMDSRAKNFVPHVDHDHKTGAVRGLLCLQCNMMLGRLERRGVFAATKLYLGEKA